MENNSFNYIKRSFKVAIILAIISIIIAFAEAGFSTYFGYEDESLTLFGFGIGSFIEIFSASGIVMMISRIKNNPESNRSSFERTALKITGYGFYILVAGLIISSLYNIYTDHKPSATISGVVISLLSILLMLILYFSKIKVGKQLKSDAIIADAECTKVCIYMSIVLLISSALFYYTQFKYADIIGTFLLAYLSFKEGKEALEKSISNNHCTC